jgi:predicted lipid-binding transport protein (Tim44 family)
MNNVLLGLIAIVIFRILFKKFGTLTKEEYNKREKAIQNFVKQQNNSPSGCFCQKTKKIKEVTPLCALKQIKQENTLADSEEKLKDQFDEVSFLKSVEIAISTIVDAFNNKNLAELEYFCSKDMFKTFKQNIELSNQRKENYRTVLVSFLNKQIIDKKLLVPGIKNYVSVKIKTEQINYVEDEQKNVIRGSKGEIQTIEELWKFELENQKDNVWVLTSIS